MNPKQVAELVRSMWTDDPTREKVLDLMAGTYRAPDRYDDLLRGIDYCRVLFRHEDVTPEQQSALLRWTKDAHLVCWDLAREQQAPIRWAPQEYVKITIERRTTSANRDDDR